jgi:hypothetical protein
MFCRVGAPPHYPLRAQNAWGARGRAGPTACMVPIVRFSLRPSAVIRPAARRTSRSRVRPRLPTPQVGLAAGPLPDDRQRIARQPLSCDLVGRSFTVTHNVWSQNGPHGVIFDDDGSLPVVAPQLPPLLTTTLRRSSVPLRYVAGTASGCRQRCCRGARGRCRPAATRAAVWLV